MFCLVFVLFIDLSVVHVSVISLLFYTYRVYYLEMTTLEMCHARNVSQDVQRMRHMLRALRQMPLLQSSRLCNVTALPRPSGSHESDRQIVDDVTRLDENEIQLAVKPPPDGVCSSRLTEHTHFTS